VQPTGAQRNTQHPHSVNFKGVISLTTKPLPAPTISPLNSNYESEIDRLKTALNRVSEGAVETHQFKSFGEFAGQIAELVEKSTPYAISTGGE
jgi:CRISPR-associated protein Cst2